MSGLVGVTTRRGIPIYLDNRGVAHRDRRSPDRPNNLRLARVHQAYRMLQEVERSLEPGSREEELAIKVAAGLLRVTT